MAVGGFKTACQISRDAALYEEAANAGAALPGRTHRAEENSAHGEIEIGIIHHDDRVVAAEFQQSAAQPAAHGFGDDVTHAARARGADQRNPAVFKKASADGGIIADDQAEYAAEVMTGEYAIGNLVYGNGGQRSLERRFPQNAIATDGGEQRVPGPYGHRKVERGNHADDPERVPLFVHAVLGAFARHGEPVELARQADGEIGDVDHLLHFAFSFGQDLAHFERDQSTEIVFVQTQLVADFTNDLAAPRSGNHPPSLEDLDSLRDNGIVIGGG